MGSVTYQRRLIFLIVTVAANVCGCGGSPPESDPSSSPGPTGTTATEPPVLNFANFIEQIAPDTLTNFTLMYLGRDPNCERPGNLAAEIRYVIPREGAPAHERLATAFATSAATSAGAWSGARIASMRRS
jgi:hypothetical protein